MTAWIARLRYFLSDAWDEARHSPGSNLLALLTLAAALFVAGLALLLYVNAARQVDRWSREARVEVYLRDDASGPQVEALRAAMAAVPGVERVDFVDKQAALALFRAAFGDLADIPALLGSNPLPASLEARLAPGPSTGLAGQAVASAVSGKPGVEEARFDGSWLARLESALDLARAGGTVLALAVFGALAFVMAGVLRLAVLARSDEIDIMLLVGAGPGLVRGPFLVSGLAHGVLASAAALAAVEAVRRLVLAQAAGEGAAALRLALGGPLTPAAMGLLAGLGAAVGLAGAFLAVRPVARAERPQKS